MASAPESFRRPIPRIATWRLFLTARARLERLLDEDLRAEHDLTLTEYDALLQLAESPTRRLRMHEISGSRRPQQKRRHPAHRSPGPRRLGRAEQLFDRRARRRGGPSLERPGAPAHCLADTSARHLRPLP